MTMTNFADITAYYDNSRIHSDTITTKTLAQIFEEWEEPFVRWPIRNREPRTPIDSQKRAIIHERDGGVCRLCGTGGRTLTVDHIIPRSAFPSAHIRYADRSDNLHSACWPCNEAKSNYESVYTKRLGVVAQCWYCANPEYAYDGDISVELPYPVRVLVFCGRCGISNVPEVAGWVL